MTVLAKPGTSGYAQAIETAPVATLSLTGAVVGGLWGMLLGFAAAKLFHQDEVACTIVGAGAGAITLGLEGFRQGTELNQWLSQY